MPDDGDQVWCRASGALHRRTLKGVLLLAPLDEEPVLISGPGGAAWDLLDEPIGFDALCSDLADLYGVDVAQIAPDVDRLLAELEGRGAVVRT